MNGRRPAQAALPGDGPRTTSGVMPRGTQKRQDVQPSGERPALAKSEAPTLPPPANLVKEADKDRPGKGAWRRRHGDVDIGATEEKVVVDLKRDPRSEP